MEVAFPDTKTKSLVNCFSSFSLHSSIEHHPIEHHPIEHHPIEHHPIEHQPSV
jgi:hypothetical protein